MITQASPFFHSAAVPFAKAIGSIPTIIESVVIRIGRIRPFPAMINASLKNLPSAFNWLVKSTIRIAFFTTNPINIIKPNKANKLKLLNDKFNAKNAPIAATGIENKTTRSNH